ncbi:hypothetical protein LY90DRAFT_626378 [Neocallimastix californiae]|uniref:Uncharacterized protein n=1 Tax=Neocallimastix californiae TaxID=1754190 RepID=A0A1Y2BEA8_9FUNG|nr:hypothetical protein LY90DRAFT_626378 [Neocallimastix californiae]|eukprot:ORY33161.1 hypothetical protein LY90DRAFT_626378 [Neocallimastix californiae]
MDERESIIQDFGSPDVLFSILKRLKIDDNVNIADFTFVYRKLYDCLPTEYAKQITIKDYLNSLDILRNITKMMDWENSRMSFRKTLECIKVFVLSYTNMTIQYKNLYKGTNFDSTRPFNEENKLTYSKICGEEIKEDTEKKGNDLETNEFKENYSIKRKINEEEISRPYKKIKTNTTLKKLKINKRPRNIRKHKINDNYKINQDNKNKEINKWDYVIAEYEKLIHVTIKSNR